MATSDEGPLDMPNKVICDLRVVSVCIVGGWASEKIVVSSFEWEIDV